jgi:hypothetical protein
VRIFLIFITTLPFWLVSAFANIGDGLLEDEKLSNVKIITDIRDGKALPLPFGL